MQEVRGSDAGDIGRLLRDMPEVSEPLGQELEGTVDESLSDLPRVDAGVEDGNLLGLPELGLPPVQREDPQSYSIPVFGLAADGSPKTATPTPGTPEQTVVIVPVGTPIPIYGEEVEQWRWLVASIFPAWAVNKVLAVMDCESGGNPNTTGAEGEVGLMQIHPRWHNDATYDPYGNVVAAYRISSGGKDWSAWTCG